ncbi:hypothetical protein [Chromobacterium vaccinii]|uniref:hypothetical protein n=1 Tax=Chromobacterium vaccinii TaxID=1108595 RepID=UPI0011AB2FD8|nr:hypothetical protein [Chromobacterium vaccinii]
MLKRLAVVVWWIGLFTLAIAAFAQLGIAYDAYECRRTHSAQLEAAKHEYEKLKRLPTLPHKSPSSSNPLMNDPALDKSLQEFSAMVAMQKEEQGLNACIHDHLGFSLGAVIFAIIVAACFWSISFVLGGFFLRPPRTPQ